MEIGGIFSTLLSLAGAVEAFSHTEELLKAENSSITLK